MKKNIKQISDDINQHCIFFKLSLLSNNTHTMDVIFWLTDNYF